RRGRVGNQIAHTLTTSNTQAYYFIDMNPEPKITDIARCITARYDSGIEKNVKLAYEYLIESAKNGNPYALQLLNSHRKGRGASVAMCSMSLLHHLSRIIQNQIEQNRRRRKVKTDRKTRQKIDDKKFGLGLH
ncbi:MAG: hypothetical protein U0L76_00935, partial [Ruminococcus sp.]|nr:hypothetical protein [Ruminococcus sp.]